MIRRIIALCSRDQCHEALGPLLKNYLALFDSNGGSWTNLIHEAENQGVTPLLYKCIISSGHAIPTQARRLLQSLYLRHKRSATIRNNTIAEILTVFQKNGIDCLLLKGIVLCNTVYREPGSRPMRDIDILFKKQDMHRVQKLLLGLGFCRVTHSAIGGNHHHLEPLVKAIEGLPIAIEVHKELLPGQLNDKRWSYENLNETSTVFSINGIEARTLSLEHTLNYLYLHGLRAPLSYEPFRLIHVADLVSFVELNHERINWGKLQSDFPSVYGVLSRLHFLTPWDPAVLNGLSLDTAEIPGGPGVPYRGWPLLPVKEVPVREWFTYLKNTIWPSQWWTQVYYGHIEGLDFYKARFFAHPQTLWRWAKAFAYASRLKKQKNIKI